MKSVSDLFFRKPVDDSLVESEPKKIHKPEKSVKKL